MHRKTKFPPYPPFSRGGEHNPPYSSFSRRGERYPAYRIFQKGGEPRCLNDSTPKYRTTEVSDPMLAPFCPALRCTRGQRLLCISSRACASIRSKMRGALGQELLSCGTKAYLASGVWLLVSALTFLSSVTSVLAGDCTQWGFTDGRNMVSEEKGLPDSCDPGKAKEGSEEIAIESTKNVKWVVKLGSQTYGNPTIAKGKVFVGTNNETPRDPKHVGDRGVLMCFEEATGKFLWQLVVPKLASGKVNDWEFLGLLSAPTVDGERVYTVTNRCEVLCLDVNGLANGNDGPFKHEGFYLDNPDKFYDPAKLKEKPKFEPGPADADILWRYDMMDELGVFPHNASNCSIILHGNLLYTCTSNGQDWTHVNIPSPKAPSFIALDKLTGAFVAEDDAGIGPRIFHGQWSSPSLARIAEKTQIYYGGGDGVCYAFDAAPEKAQDTQFLRKIWWFDCNPPGRKVGKNGKKIKYPSYEGPSEIIATPVAYKNRVYVVVGQDPEHGEGLGILHCIDATKTGEITKTGSLWSCDKIMRSMSTVSIADGLLYIADFSGQVHCLDAETGQVYWVHKTGAHIWGSTLVADGKVYIGNEDGDFFIFAASKEKKLLNGGAPIHFNAPIYATPVVANGVLYLGTQTHLYALEAPKK